MSTVAFWPAGEHDACSFYRCHEPARVLAELGHRVACRRDLTVEDLAALAPDVVVGARITEEEPLERWQRLARERRGTRPMLVYDWDDDLLSTPEDHPGHRFYAEASRRERIREAIRSSDVVTSPSSRLAEVSRAIHPAAAVRVVPNYVPRRFLTNATAEEFPGVEIVWGGSGTHHADWRRLIEPLRDVLRAHADVRVHVIGPDVLASLRASVPDGETRIRHTPWLDRVPRYLEQLGGDLGLAPLEDTTFNRAKSDIKIKEYAARGIAPLASSVSPYAESLVPRIADAAPRAWHERIEHAITSPALREAATRAHEWARANTLEAHAKDWSDALGLKL